MVAEMADAAHRFPDRRPACNCCALSHLRLPRYRPSHRSLATHGGYPTTIARWVQQLGGSGKTIANKHGFLSGAMKAAVTAG